MENQRIRLTKKMLKDALIVLLENKNINEITITELCKKAQINRVTFYKYYNIPNDVLKEIKDEMFDSMNQIISNYQKDNSHLISALEYLKDNRNILIVLINNISSKEIEDSLFYLRDVKKILLNRIPQTYKKIDIENLYQFICYGSYSIITQWIKNDCKQSTEDIADFIHKTTNKLL